MGGECSAYGRDERRIQGFGEGNLRERDHLGDPGVYGWIILTLRLLMSYIYIYIYGAPSKARNANVVYIWTYVWQR